MTFELGLVLGALCAFTCVTLSMLAMHIVYSHVSSGQGVGDAGAEERREEVDAVLGQIVKMLHEHGDRLDRVEKTSSNRPGNASKPPRKTPSKKAANDG